MPEPSTENVDLVPGVPDEAPLLVEDSLVLAAFRDYAAELDARHDRNERLVKLSRDVTIESKRIIFFLHSLTKEYTELGRTLGMEAAEKRIIVLAQGPLARAAKELQGLATPHSLSSGLQELAEAACFLHHLKHPGDTLPPLTCLQDLISSANESEEPLHLRVSPVEFILGVADYTGELMRLCINSLAGGDVSGCYAIRTLLQNLLTCFLSLDGFVHPEMRRKVTTLHHSVLKVESACCDLKLRGRSSINMNNAAHGDTIVA